MGFNKQVIIKIIGVIILIIGFAMIPPLIVSIIYNEAHMTKAFGFSIVPMLAIGFIIIKATKPLNSALRTREGILIVALCWVLTSAFGALPYMLSGILPSFVDAFFESVSGFTTTGATIISNLSSIPKSLLFWRSFSHWLGGMGILVFAISILPALGIGAQNIAKAETPGPTLDKMTTRFSDNAKILYLIYIGFSCAELLLLVLSDMRLFDALIHTFGSMGTGGLSNYEEGIAHFNSFYIELIVSLFCLLASINFISYNDLLRGWYKDFLKDPEVRAFGIFFAASALIITAVLFITGTYTSFGESMRHAFFQVASFMSTSGYASADYGTWPAICRWILFSLLFVGGCSSSTAGGIKIVRVVIMFKLIKRSILKRLHPRAVIAVKLGDRPVSAETVSSITVFIYTYFIVFLVSVLILSLENLDMLTTISTAAATISNTGIGFGEIGYANTFDVFSQPARLFLSFLMIAGRLELFTIIILLTPSYWRPNSQ